MKPTITTNSEAAINDEIVRKAIAYLDSPTNYREFIPHEEDRPATSHRQAKTCTSDDGDIWLLLVPVLVIVLALITAIAR